MAGFIGEYDCKIDSKGRITLPAALRRQLPPEAGDTLVLNRGFDKCLVLYTRADWQKETEKLSHLNAFNKLDRQFIRLFNNGASEVAIDTASRILVSKPLVTYAGLTDHVVLFAYGNRIEIWSQANYDEQLNIDADAFSELAEKVMGNNKAATET